jgi:hypothetical protein
MGLARHHQSRMAAQGRPTAAPSLPTVEDATVPFSALFIDNKNKSGFDLRTVEATAQLADRSIFVASNGRRFLVESLPDEKSSGAVTRASGGPPTIPSSPPESPTSARPNESRPSAAQSFGALLRNSLRRRPPSSTSARTPSSPWGTRSPQSPIAAPSPVSPAAPTEPQIATMTSHVNPNRFSATPLYWESDGGVQAAEALTDPYLGPRQPTSPGGSSSPVSPTTQLTPHSPAPPYGLPAAPDSGIPSHAAGPSNHVTNFDYVHYTAQLNYQTQQSRQVPGATGGLPSLMEYSSPMVSPRAGPSGCSPVDPPFYDHEKQFAGDQVGGVYLQPPRSSASGPSSSPVPIHAGPQVNYVNIGRTYSSGDGYDTLTPVVVAPEITHAPSHSSDGASTSRDNVLPGEIVLYDGPVKSAQTLNAPIFIDGQLKVFRNTLSNDLRFHCRIGHESETYWIKAMNAQLVPIYAYDPRFPNVIYIRDNESEKGNNYLQSAPGNGRPSGIYQFDRFKDLSDFQAKLTAEKVVLDITSVKLVRLGKDSRSSDTYNTVRLQIWHEAELRRSTQSDVASFVTAGTALSGPLRERLVPNSSRLIVYLGRMGEYITLFITDDIELRVEGPTMVKLKPRKAGSFSKKGSRWQGIKAHIERKGSFEMAGLDIHGQPMNPDLDATYDLYKTYEIDFENSPSQDNFIRKWDEVMKERRQQRVRLNQIKEEMGQNVFSGPTAREIW